MADIVLQAEQLTKTYSSADKKLTVLDQVSFQAVQGTSLAIIGPSGSGKTTLLGLCAGLDVPTSGSVALMGLDRKSTRLNSSHITPSRMPSSA